MISQLSAVSSSTVALEPTAVLAGRSLNLLSADQVELSMRINSCGKVLIEISPTRVASQTLDEFAGRSVNLLPASQVGLSMRVNPYGLISIEISPISAFLSPLSPSLVTPIGLPRGLEALGQPSYLIALYELSLKNGAPHHYFKKPNEFASAHVFPDSVFFKKNSSYNPNPDPGATKKLKIAWMHVFSTLELKVVARLVSRKNQVFSRLESEFTIMKALNGIAGIPRVYHKFEGPNKKGIPTFTLYMELANKGSALGYAETFRSGVLPRALTKILAKQWIYTLHSMHAKQIVHCDIKPDNLLIHEEDGEVKGLICDFDNSLAVQSNPILIYGTLVYFTPVPVCGTPVYFSPEKARSYLLGNGWKVTDEYAADVWALGVSIFDLMSDVRHWISDDDRYVKEIAERRSGTYIAAKDPFSKLLSEMTVCDPSKRLTIDQAKAAIDYI